MGWDYIDIDNFYNRVRAILGVSDEKYLTDEAIDFPEKAPTADRFIKSLIPQWEQYATQATEDDITKFAIFQSCIVYQTAIYFYKYIKERQIKTRSTPDIKIEYSTSGNIKDNIGKPLDEILSDLLAQITSTDTTKGFFGFMVT